MLHLLACLPLLPAIPDGAGLPVHTPQVNCGVIALVLITPDPQGMPWQLWLFGELTTWLTIG